MLHYIFVPEWACLKRPRVSRLVERGVGKLERSTDILTLVRLESQVAVLTRLLLSPAQRALFRHQARLALRERSSESSAPSDSRLDGLPLASEADRKLWRGVFAKRRV